MAFPSAATDSICMFSRVMSTRFLDIIFYLYFTKIKKVAKNDKKKIHLPPFSMPVPFPDQPGQDIPCRPAVDGQSAPLGGKGSHQVVILPEHVFRIHLDQQVLIE